MNKQNKVLTLIFAGLLLINLGFSWKHREAAKEPAKETAAKGPGILGIWKYKNPSKGPSRMTFLGGHNFEVDKDGDGKRDIWGEYSVSKDRLVLINKGGTYDSTCKAAGVYEYSISLRQLKLKKVSDQCVSRTEALGN